MTQEFLPYERAVKLKQLGFDEPCFGYYIELVKPVEGILTIEKCDKNIDGCLAPTFSQAFRWFRDEHQLDTSNNIVYSKFNDTISKKYSGVLRDKSAFINVGFYDTYEEVELACLDKLIEIVELKEQEP